MEPERWRRVREVLEQAIELPEGDRTDYLDQAADGDPELRQEVESLLAAHEQDASVLEQPPPAPPETTRVGQRLDRYVLEELIGRGGMGEVYRGRRDDGEFEQQVAIKMMRPGFDTEGLARRFATERQVLADLAHPNVARLLDGGTAPDGSPYLVMELIEGEPLDRFCEQHGLDLPSRLRLFLSVCETVAFAHRAGLIHRDLKPGNVLVTADGQIKLLDFGLAKVLSPDGPGERTTTIAAYTPRYASPEQRLGEELSLASDVYSLGVMLQELVDPASCPPRRHDAHLSAGAVAVATRARESDPTGRYPSAAELAGDLAALIGGGPVAAMSWRRLRAARAGMAAHPVLALGAGAVVALALGVALARSWPGATADLPVFEGTLSPVVSWPSRETHSRISADGRRVAFISDRNGEPSLWIQDLDTRADRLVAPVARYVAGLAWSPADDSIAIVESVSEPRILRVISLRQETEDLVLPLRIPRIRGLIRWTPEGLYALGDGNLWRIELPSGQVERVTREDVDLDATGADILPHTGQAVLARWVDEREDLWLSALDGSDLRRLTDTPEREYDPTWIGTSGARVGFVSNRRGQIDLFEMDVRTGRSRFLTSDLNRETELSTSAAGDRIVFSAVRESADLWRIDPLTGAGFQLTADAQSDLWPQVTDSGRLLFHRTRPTLDAAFRQFSTEILLSASAALRPGDTAQRLGTGIVAQLSANERWLAYASPTARATGYDLWLEPIEDPGGRVLLTDRYWPASIDLFPLGYLGRHVGWTAASSRLLFVQGPPGDQELLAFDPGSGETATLASGIEVIDLLADPRRATVATREAGAVAIGTLVPGATRLETALRWSPEEFTSLRLLAWRGDELFLLVGTEQPARSSASLVAIGPDGSARVVTDVPGGIPHTAVLLPGAAAAILTVTVDGIDNLHRVGLDDGTLTRITDNALPSVTFSAPAVSADGIIVSRQLDDSNVWTLSASR